MSRKLMPTISILLLIAMLVLVGMNGATIAARGTHDEVLQALPAYRWALDQEEQ